MLTRFFAVLQVELNTDQVDIQRSEVATSRVQLEVAADLLMGG